MIEIRKEGNWVEDVEKDAQITSSKWQWDGTNRIPEFDLVFIHYTGAEFGRIVDSP